MNKYFLVAKGTWEEMLTYRLNFAMWRFRVVLQLLTIYFLWYAILPANTNLFGYSQSLMLTYILGTSLVFSIVLATRTQEIGSNINNGNLSTYLLKPINYFLYWFWRDLGDKSMNIFFSCIEYAILFSLIHPPLFIQTDIRYLGLMGIALVFAMVLNFLIGCLLGMIGFWNPEIWAPRFLYFVFLTYFSGTFFPLDIFPGMIGEFLKSLPFAFLLYYPIKIYLGQLSFFQIYQGLLLCLLWIGISWGLLQFLWAKGIKTYEAAGR